MMCVKQLVAVEKRIHWTDIDIAMFLCQSMLFSPTKPQNIKLRTYISGP